MRPRPSRRHRPTARLGAAGAAALVMVAAGCSGGHGPSVRAAADSPRPLHGVPLTGPTRLRLLLPSSPPTLLDVDGGTSQTVVGLPEPADRLFWVQPVGADAVIVATKVCDDCVPASEVFVVRRGTTTATAVGEGWDVAPSRDGRGLWLLCYTDATSCTLREVGLDGRPRRPARRVSCGIQPREETPLGLLAWTSAPDRNGPVTSALLDPDDGRPLLRFPQIHAVVGELVLSSGAGDQGPFTITDRRTGTRQQVARPSGVGPASDGLVSPDQRHVAISFENPAWPGTNAQVMDVWLLDLVGRRWRRLPAMPVLAELKFTSMAWTDDGRLLLLGSFGGVGDALAVWRPGQDRLAVRPIPLPPDRADAFVAWDASPAAGR
jgi:hypothetical protein